VSRAGEEAGYARDVPAVEVGARGVRIEPSVQVDDQTVAILHVREQLQIQGPVQGIVVKALVRPRALPGEAVRDGQHVDAPAVEARGDGRAEGQLLPVDADDQERLGLHQALAGLNRRSIRTGPPNPDRTCSNPRNTKTKAASTTPIHAAEVPGCCPKPAAW